MIDPTMSNTGALVYGSTRFGTTPGGGTPAGVTAICSGVSAARGLDMTAEALESAKEV